MRKLAMGYICVHCFTPTLSSEWVLFYSMNIFCKRLLSGNNILVEKKNCSNILVVFPNNIHWVKAFQKQSTILYSLLMFSKLFVSHTMSKLLFLSCYVRLYVCLCIFLSFSKTLMSNWPIAKRFLMEKKKWHWSQI